MANKKAFYPTDEVEEYFENIPKGQISSRVNELIIKGLSFEHQEKVRESYASFNAALAKEKPRKMSIKGISKTMMMSAKAFEKEDEVEDFI